MEDHAARPEPSLTPEEELRVRLERLEREAAELRRTLSQSQPQAPSAQQAGAAGVPDVPQGVEYAAASAPLPARAPEETATATPQQIEAAEKLLALARLAKSRQQTQQMMQYLQQAEAAAPNAPNVLEFIGDEMAEKGHMRDARDVYAKALALDPANVRLGRKHANSIFFTTGAAHMRPPNEGADAVAGPKAAFILCVFLPGLGQIVRKEYVKGAVMMAIYLSCAAWLTLMRVSLALMLTKLFGGSDPQHHQFNSIVIWPLIIGILTYLGSLFDAGAAAKSSEHKLQMPERPKPPEDLPFE